MICGSCYGKARDEAHRHRRWSQLRVRPRVRFLPKDLRSPPADSNLKAPGCFGAMEELGWIVLLVVVEQIHPEPARHKISLEHAIGLYLAKRPPPSWLL